MKYLYPWVLYWLLNKTDFQSQPILSLSWIIWAKLTCFIKYHQTIYLNILGGKKQERQRDTKRHFIIQVRMFFPFFSLAPGYGIITASSIVYLTPGMTSIPKNTNADDSDETRLRGDQHSRFPRSNTRSFRKVTIASFPFLLSLL